MKLFLSVLTFLFISCNSNSQTKNNDKINELLKLANTADSLMDLKNSIKYYSEILQIDSTKLIALNNRGRALVWNGQLKEGFSDFDKIVKLYPSENAFYRRGMAYLFANQYEKAISDFTQTIALNPKFSEAYYYLSIVKLKQEELDSVLSLCQQADEISYKPELSILIKTLLYKKKKEFNALIDLLDKAIENSPNDPLHYNERGLAKNELKQYKDAIIDFDKALKLNPQMAFAYNNKAFSLFNLKELEKAFKNVNLSLELNNKNSFAFKNRGNMYIAQNEIEKACLDFTNAEKFCIDNDLKIEIEVLTKKYCKK